MAPLPRPPDPLRTDSRRQVLAPTPWPRRRGGIRWVASAHPDAAVGVVGGGCLPGGAALGHRPPSRPARPPPRRRATRGAGPGARPRPPPPAVAGQARRAPPPVHRPPP